ncbi:hypothetical protein EGW08_000923 [Elysia chlorotica]|uniref:Uncharacterized protein n=1 Tax=Elysia chlorotica TaxID=188477 RepID=A0A3S1I338_ELYCH|nr:hypothetical protein EGW08_000923 [Elysia chlorotica]
MHKLKERIKRYSPQPDPNRRGRHSSIPHACEYCGCARRRNRVRPRGSRQQAPHTQAPNPQPQPQIPQALQPPIGQVVGPSAMDILVSGLDQVGIDPASVPSGTY